jgi:hypothetical protein
MDDCVGLEVADHRGEEGVIGAVADLHLEPMVAGGVEYLRAHLEPGVVEQRFGIGFGGDAAAGVGVDGEHLMARGGKEHRGRPAEIAVTAENQDPHRPSLPPRLRRSAQHHP